MLIYWVALGLRACRIFIDHVGSLRQCESSVGAACELSCPVAYGISVPQPGIKPASPALEGGFLTIGPQGCPHRGLLKRKKGLEIKQPSSSVGHSSILEAAPLLSRASEQGLFGLAVPRQPCQGSNYGEGQAWGPKGVAGAGQSWTWVVYMVQSLSCDTEHGALVWD